MAETTPHEMVIPAAFPALSRLLWNREATQPIPCEEALAIYERNWRFVDIETLSEDERRFIRHLSQSYGNGLAMI